MKLTEAAKLTPGVSIVSITGYRGHYSFGVFDYVIPAEPAVGRRPGRAARIRYTGVAKDEQTGTHFLSSYTSTEPLGKVAVIDHWANPDELLAGLDKQEVERRDYKAAHAAARKRAEDALATIGVSKFVLNQSPNWTADLNKIADALEAAANTRL
jgi:hypothetical protein